MYTIATLEDWFLVCATYAHFFISYLKMHPNYKVSSRSLYDAHWKYKFGQKKRIYKSNRGMYIVIKDIAIWGKVDKINCYSDSDPCQCTYNVIKTFGGARK